MQNGEQRRGQESGCPRARFAFDGRVHDAAKHGVFEECDADTGSYADEEDVGEARGRGSEFRVPDAQPGREQEGGADAGRRHAHRSPEQGYFDESAPGQAVAEVGLAREMQMPAQPNQLDEEHQHGDAAGDPVERPVGKGGGQLVGGVGDTRADQPGKQYHGQKPGEGAHSYSKAAPAHVSAETCVKIGTPARAKFSFLIKVSASSARRVPARDGIRAHCWSLRWRRCAGHARRSTYRKGRSPYSCVPAPFLSRRNLELRRSTSHRPGTTAARRSNLYGSQS